MLLPVLLLIFAQDLSHRGPTRIQQDLLKLIAMSNHASSLSHACKRCSGWLTEGDSIVNRNRNSKVLNFWENCLFAFWRYDPRWRISAILDFRGPEMGFLKTLCTTSYRSSIDTIALNCLVFEKIPFLCFGDRQTNKQKTDRRTDGQHRSTKPLLLSRAAA